jgi:curli biogenesis system outer membrane secretion channel CsgG
MRTALPTVSRTFLRLGAGACLLLAAVAAPLAGGQKGDAKEAKKPVVLVPPFENLSKHHENIFLEVATNNNPKAPKRKWQVDRYSEAPRAFFENALSNVGGVTIVERQRVDQLLVEGQFGQSGFVDQKKAIEFGKLIGANTIAMGTIADVREETKSFKGYGVETENVVVTAQVRVRVLDIETGEVVYSKILKGSKTYTKTSFGQTKSSDRNFAAIEAAIETLGEDPKFKAALLGKGADAAADGLIEVEFAPKPDNCDIEIDGKYVGGSPLKRKLKAGTEYKIRISKSGFVEWTGVIAPEAGLKITRELEPKK